MISEKLTILARPYALAAFETAVEDDLAAWETMLHTAAFIAEDKKVIRLLNNPEMSRQKLSDLFCDVLGKLLDTKKKNFIWLLAEHGRLVALPEIAKLFSGYREEYEKTITVQLVSAIPLDEKYKRKFTEALTRRLKRKIILEHTVDETLLGGALVRAGDKVIDGSVRGKLNRLVDYLT